jgi:hypothetical protein
MHTSFAPKCQHLVKTNIISLNLALFPCNSSSQMYFLYKIHNVVTILVLNTEKENMYSFKCNVKQYMIGTKRMVVHVILF